MFFHNLKLIFRNFIRFKSTFLINLIGLSTGLASALFIYLWVMDELSVDKFHEKDARLYHVLENDPYTSGLVTKEESAGLLAETLAEEMPEVEFAAAKAFGNQDIKITLGAEEKDIKAVVEFVGKDFFNVFSYPLMHGSADQVLADKKSIVLSESLAKSFFGSTDNAIGKVLTFKVPAFIDPVEDNQFHVTGVYQDLPLNSSHKFDYLISFEYWKDIAPWTLSWGNTAPHTYLVLKEGVDAKLFQSKIKDFLTTKLSKTDRTLFMRKFSDGYLYGKYENGVQAGGRIEYVKLFSIAAVFILLIASINFMNLSTAKALRRAKEVGVKKAIGAGRATLISQYLTESFLITLISLLLGLTLVQSLLPFFSSLTGKFLTLNFDLNLILSIVALTILTGLISGSYPALYLSAFNPIAVLKGKISTSSSEISVRKGLVVFQFVLSVVLIVSVIVVYRQIDYIQHKNLGYNKDNMLHFDKEGRIQEHIEAFLSAVKEIPGVVNASIMSESIINSTSGTSGIDWQGKKPDEHIHFSRGMVYYDMLDMLDIEMKEGRIFSREFASDSSGIILNEAAIDLMGLDDPIGQKVHFWGMEKTIIGVSRNFHYGPLHNEVKPFVFVFMPENTQKVMVKIAVGKEKETIAGLDKLYKNFNPGFPFEYKFFDEEFHALYVAEQKVSILSRYFAGIAILISCLGLFGLAAFTAERRIKEIGIRKVMGSSSFGIIRLLSEDFTKLVILAIIIGLPLSYYISKNWLDNFAYRIELEWWYFAAAGFVLLIITWLTVGMQAYKAAKVNPTECLRNE
jgi:putative ABC transport system permease protein